MQERRPLQICLLGREAVFFKDSFEGEEVRLGTSHEHIRPDDDFVFCLSYPRLVPPEVLARPRVGVFVSHSSDLPKGRGWAPLQWSVLNGLDSVIVTMFKATAELDAGDWCFKESYPIEPHDTIDVLYAKDQVVTERLLRRLIVAYREGTLTLHRQEGEPEYWRRRTAADSELDPSKTLAELWDHIRVCDNEKYPAFFRINGRRVYLRYSVLPDDDSA